MQRLSFQLMMLLLLLSACSSSKKAGSKKETTRIDTAYDSFILSETTTDTTYGYTISNAIKVGGAKNSSGPANERRFLNGLLGPNGEELTYKRLGSCCHFETPNGFMGGGLLDKYEVTWKGQEKPVIIYINMYDGDKMYVCTSWIHREITRRKE